MKQIFVHIFLVVFVGVFAVGLAQAVGVEEFKVMKISARDHRAVVKAPEGKLRVVGVGDLFTENVRVIEISAKRVVLERVADRDIETIVIRVCKNGQTIERYHRNAGHLPLLTVPADEGS